MDLRVASIVLLMAALAAAHGKGYVVKKVVKPPPQYEPYSVKSQGKKSYPSPPFASCWIVRFHLQSHFFSPKTDLSVDDPHYYLTSATG